MGFNEFLSSIFGNKSTRDMKEIQPWVEKIKAAYPEVAKLDNDALRAKTEELKAYIHDSAAEQRAKVEELKASVENTELEEREELFAQIDKLEKEILDIYEKALDEVLPAAFSIVKETAKRFSENEEITVTATEFDRHLAATKDFVRIEGDKAIYQNHWVAGGNDTVWNMVHYDVQLFGGVVLHKGKIAEMATGEGKTLVGTLPLYLNALPGKNAQLVTVNDYLARRDSEWMGYLYNFLGLTVGCATCHDPHSVDTAPARVEACVSCHDDGHTKAYFDSPHYALFQAELAGEGAPGSGVGCADCHMPRLEDPDSGKVFVTHNQNETLRPNEKMIRSTCLSCHGLAFSIDALADPVLVERNFAGKPSAHVESIDWAVKRAASKGSRQ